MGYPQMLRTPFRAVFQPVRFMAMPLIKGRASTTPAAADRESFTPVATSHLRPRRSPRLVAAGVLLACLGGLGGAMAYQQASHANQVVVVSRTVPRGATIGSGDLSVVTIGPAPGVHTVDGRELTTLVGQQALNDLPAGSLLGRESVGRAQLAEGSAQLGLKLGAGRVPNQAMPPGTPVQLVEVSGDQAGGSQLVVEATLVTAPQTLPDGSSKLVDVAVPSAQAQRLADLAAHDLLVVVRRAGG